MGSTWLQSTAQENKWSESQKMFEFRRLCQVRLCGVRIEEGIRAGRANIERSRKFENTQALYFNVGGTRVSMHTSKYCSLLNKLNKNAGQAQPLAT